MSDERFETMTVEEIACKRFKNAEISSISDIRIKALKVLVSNEKCKVLLTFTVVFLN